MCVATELFKTAKDLKNLTITLKCVTCTIFLYIHTTSKQEQPHIRWHTKIFLNSGIGLNFYIPYAVVLIDIHEIPRHYYHTCACLQGGHSKCTKI